MIFRGLFLLLCVFLFAARPGLADPSVLTAPLKISGGSYTIDVTINHNPSHASFLVDSGATIMVISDRLAKELGYEALYRRPKMSLTTLTGRSLVPLVVLDSLGVGDMRVTNLVTAVSDTLPHGLDGLLGADFLDQFVYRIDGAKSQLTLKPLPEKHRNQLRLYRLETTLKRYEHLLESFIRGFSEPDMSISQLRATVAFYKRQVLAANGQHVLHPFAPPTINHPKEP